MCDFHRGKLGVVIAGTVYGIVCAEGVLLYPAEFPLSLRNVSRTLWNVLRNYGLLVSYQYTLASSRRLQRCTRILGARRVTETASLTGSREMLVLWLRHEVLETCARGKAGDKRAARRSSPRMYRLKREKSALDARHCATATAVQKRMESTKNKDFLLPDGPDDGWVVLR